MWMVDPEYMCQQHLLGEHVELHMFVGTIKRSPHPSVTLTGYAKNGLVEVHNINLRHKAIVNEMLKRGLRHQSPLPDFEKFEKGKVNVDENYNELSKRCLDCRNLIESKLE
tara:strand:- start:44596 stop:44928 length:333 start_codon:yes stop_codon:yes gene_type:complete